MNRGRAVVVGAGLGGLTAALELRRVGFEVDVFERREELGEVNTGLSLWAFAIARLAALGLSNPEEFGSPIERLVHRTAEDAPLTDVAVPIWGAASHDVHRGELQARLADALGRDRITLGTGCVRVRERTRAAEVELEDGCRETADVVIGADGVGSSVRSSLGRRVKLRREGFGAWRGIATVPPDEFPRGLHLRYMGEGGLFGIGRLSDDTIRWYAGAEFPPVPPETGEEAMPLALSAFARWPERVLHTLERTRPADYLFNDTPHAGPIRRWGAGHITLVGDAAHPIPPTLGIAGGVAIEDAAVLGESLTSERDIPAALRAYERRRRPTAWRITLAASAFERVVTAGGRLRRPRDVAFQVAPQRLGLRWLTAGGRFRRR